MTPWRAPLVGPSATACATAGSAGLPVRAVRNFTDSVKLTTTVLTMLDAIDCVERRTPSGEDGGLVRSTHDAAMLLGHAVVAAENVIGEPNVGDLGRLFGGFALSLALFARSGHQPGHSAQASTLMEGVCNSADLPDVARAGLANVLHAEVSLLQAAGLQDAAAAAAAWVTAIRSGPQPPAPEVATLQG